MPSCSQSAGGSARIVWLPVGWWTQLLGCERGRGDLQVLAAHVSGLSDRLFAVASRLAKWACLIIGLSRRLLAAGGVVIAALV